MTVTRTYFGDGVYGAFDGHSVVLTTGSHEKHGAQDEIYLEADVLRAINDWVANGYADHNTGKRWAETG